MKAQLQEIVDALNMQFDEYSSWLDLDTGHVETVSDQLMGCAEDGEEPPSMPDWQEEEWETAKKIATTDRFLSLPSKFDVHEWGIMEEFSESRQSERVREELRNAIHGSGAFRNFKDIIRRLRIEKDWYEFRDESLKKIARDWCKEHAIEYE